MADVKLAKLKNNSEQDVDNWWFEMTTEEKSEQKIQYEMEIEDMLVNWWDNLSNIQKQEVKNNTLIWDGVNDA